MAQTFGNRDQDSPNLALIEAEYEDRTLTHTTFEETLCKTALNPIAGGPMPLNWSVNTYRGCQHACTFCYARPTHEYLDLNPRDDFERHIVVKTNVVEVLRKELACGRNRGETVALGTNTDPYQRAESVYRLTRGVLEAFVEFGVPVSITTKSPTVVADVDLLAELAKGPGVSVNLSIGTVDHEVWRAAEPGTAMPEKRFAAVKRLNDAGVEAGVLMAPILPLLSDSDEQLEATVAAAAAANCRWVSPIVLHLRPKVREIYLEWLEHTYPELVARYTELYGRGSHAKLDYRRQLAKRVARLKARHGIASATKVSESEARGLSRSRPATPAQQSLFR